MVRFKFAIVILHGFKMPQIEDQTHTIDDTYRTSLRFSADSQNAKKENYCKKYCKKYCKCQIHFAPPDSPPQESDVSFLSGFCAYGKSLCLLRVGA
jgi:hypothetical protein